MSKKMILINMAFCLLAGCARIPVQSVALASAIQAEGERMHRLNLVLLANMFDAKKKDIDLFIQDKFTPEATGKFVKLVPDTTDFKKNFTKLLQALTPVINATKDSLLTGLQVQKERLVNKLNADYSVFENATGELRKLLASASKIEKEKMVLFDKARELSKNTIDLSKVQSAVDNFLETGGSAGNKINALQTTFDQLIK